MKVVILFTTMLFLLLLGYGQTYAIVSQNNNSLKPNIRKEHPFTGMQIEKHIRLKWSAINGENVNYFIIEKSSDNVFWEFVDCIDGINDNNNIMIEYIYDDYDILSYNNSDFIYYRIIQTDFEGTYFEFKPITIKFSPSVSYVLNPKSKEISIYTNNHLDEFLCVFNVFGEKIISTRIISEITVLDLSNYSGVYVIRINKIHLDKFVL